MMARLADGVLYPGELRLPAQNLALKRLEIRRAAHSLGLDQVLVQVGFNHLNRAQDLTAGYISTSSQKKLNVCFIHNFPKQCQCCDVRQFP